VSASYADGGGMGLMTPCVSNFWQSTRTGGCWKQPPVVDREPVDPKGKA
jgi:hypothetical protein